MNTESRIPRRRALAAVRRIVLALSLMLAASSLAATSLVACKGEEEKKEEKKAAIEVFEGDKPSWPSELEGVSLGQTPDEWKAAGFDEERIKSKKFKDLSYYAERDRDTGLVDEVSLSLKSDANLKDELTKRWGEPIVSKGLGSEYFVWLDPESKLRVRLDAGSTEEKRHWVRIDRYQPLAELIGTEPGPLPFEKATPLLGKTAEELLAAYPKDYRVPEGNKPDQGHFELPPTEFEANWVWLNPTFDDTGKVSAYSFTLQVPTAQRPALLEQLKARFGEPREGKEYDSTIKVYLSADHKMRVRVNDAKEDEVGFRVESYTPLSELLGADKARLAFEGDKSWLGTLAEDDFKKLPGVDPSGALLQLPPTEFAPYTTSVTPYFADGKVKSYSFNIEYGLVPGARDEILDAFKKLYGEPTVGKVPYSENVLYTYPNTPPVTVEQSYGDGWTVRVGESI